MATLARIELLDFTNPFLYSAASYMMPIPDYSVNIAAVVQPFQIEVNNSTKSFSIFFI